MALCKRRSELARAGDAADRQRPALAAYTLPMLDQMISVVAAAALIGYSIYTFTAQNLPDDRSMMLTIPFVVYGMFRYIYLVHARDAGETPGARNPDGRADARVNRALAAGVRRDTELWAMRRGRGIPNMRGRSR